MPGSHLIYSKLNITKSMCVDQSKAPIDTLDQSHALIPSRLLMNNTNFFSIFKKNHPMYAIISLHRNYALTVCKNVVVHCVYVRREVYHVFRMTSEMFPGKCIGRAMFKRKSLNHKIAGKIHNAGVTLIVQFSSNSL